MFKSDRLLGLTHQQAEMVAMMFEEGRAKIQEAVYGMGLDEADMQTLHEELAAQRQEVKKMLSSVLDEDQLWLLDELPGPERREMPGHLFLSPGKVL